MNEIVESYPTRWADPSLRPETPLEALAAVVRGACEVLRHDGRTHTAEQLERALVRVENNGDGK